MRIAAFDPGGTTGYALMTTTEKTPRLKGGQLDTKNHHYDLFKLLKSFEPDIIISESFEYRARSRSGLVLDSKEYIGIFKLYSSLEPVRYLEQMPAQAKGFVTDTNLEQLGMYTMAQEHCRDAFRHLVYFVVNNKIATEYEELKSVRLQWLNRAYRVK